MNNVRDIEEWWWQPVWRSKTTKSCGGMLSILYRFPLKLHSKQPCKGPLNYYYRSIEWIKNILSWIPWYLDTTILVAISENSNNLLLSIKLINGMLISFKNILLLHGVLLLTTAMFAFVCNCVSYWSILYKLSQYEKCLSQKEKGSTNNDAYKVATTIWSTFKILNDSCLYI